VLDHVEAKTLRHSVLATIVVVCAIVFALLVLVVPVYGPAFRQATVLGLILLPGVALLGFCGPLSATIVGRGRPDLTLAGTLVVTPLTVLLYALLIPLMHATGAALGSSLSYAGMSVLTAVFYRRVTGTNPLSLMVPTRSEVDDYRNLAQAVRRAVGSMLARLAGRRSGSGL
jgi:O-antigen/teichoic acid export membrane protein